MTLEKEFPFCFLGQNQTKVPKIGLGHFWRPLKNCGSVRMASR